ncbi:uroporphyrinogen-III synthase [Leucobacter tenebrionis]|uniref:uroporphyrinogen-III synthase n=1 Tax=Leucobacter tenebrionis TaxID=2873270 RepID=UPI001CA7850B|nr:uroporphyrinogen-III synthase [Leucobacter tenebrionis]QZY53024.1 uroporphyrinogen-III synthase [Leucobacter tenebrionis]
MRTASRPRSGSGAGFGSGVGSGVGPDPASALPHDGQPLAARRVLVPRGGAAGERWAAAIRELGGEPVVSPLTETAPPADTGALAAAAERWNRGEYDWLVVTSANAVRAFAEAGARPGSAAVAAVGPATAEALRERGFEVALTPERDFSATGIAEALLARIGPGGNARGAGADARTSDDRAADARTADGRAADARGADGRGADGRTAPQERNGSAATAPVRLLLPLSEIASTELETALAAAGHDPDRVTAYRTVPAARDAAAEAEVAAGRIDAILAMSGSGAREIARRFAPLPPGTLIIAIGGPTARALAGCGVEAAAVASEHTVDGVLAAFVAALDPASEPDPTSRPDPAPELDPAADPASPARSTRRSDHGGTTA